jgi:hypothetical protein
MYHSRGNPFKLLVAALLIVAASAGCGRIVEPDQRDCRDEFEPPEGYRPLCEHVNPIQ